MLNTRDKPESSPCIGICSHATGDVVCRGCGRTLEEVRDWNTYTVEQKLEVKRRIKMKVSRLREMVTNKPHYWKEREGMYKVRYGAWVWVGHDCINARKNYLYWSMQSNEKPS